MKLRSLRPSRLLQMAGAGLALIALVSAWISAVIWLWWAALLCVLSIAAVDAAWARRSPPISVSRHTAANLPLGHQHEIALRISHNCVRACQLELSEWVSDGLQAPAMPLEVTLAPGRESRVVYSVLPLARGEQAIEAIDLTLHSPLGLWRVCWHLPLQTGLRIYPDFAAIAQDLNPDAGGRQSGLSGLRRQPRRGTGTDFHQLRDYREGDSLRQIDWKATSRRREFIAREYQEERDQQIVILLDLGRRMRADTHLDQAINASLLVGYSALRQGDAFGLLTFGGDQLRWLPPRKGVATINQALNAVYDLEPSLRASDYAGAAQWLSERLRKRALVVVVTNTRDEDQAELQTALGLLRKRHLVMLANLREPGLDALLREPLESLPQGLRYVGAVEYVERRSQLQRRLRAEGALLVDCVPAELPRQLTSAYHAVKRSGQL